MEPIEICPPWWPRILWWLIRVRPPIPDPPPYWDEMAKLTETMLVALQGYHVAATFDSEVRAQVQRTAVRQMQEAVGQLAELQYEQ